MEMVITLPGNKRVDAAFNGFIVKTDQSPSGGGEGSAPEPFDYFLASIGACAGIYIVGFCEARDIPYQEIRLTQTTQRDPKTKDLIGVKIEIHLPPDFPAKYDKAVVRVAGLCAVKEKILNPPGFEITASR